MKNYKIKFISFSKNIFILIIFVLLNLFFAQKILASTLTLSTEKETVHQEEQFLVDVNLLTNKDENINAFDISISYSPNLTFLGSKSGLSIIGIWIEKPNIKPGFVNFSGIIPGGFRGLIDPMTSDPINNQKSGLITQLIFLGNKEGQSIIDFNKQIILANDGLGTILETNSNSLTINIGKKNIPSIIDINDNNPPDNFSIILSRDILLFDGKYAISFETKDKESGINYYEIKEEGKNWQKADSPYLLQNQPPIGTIFVKAVDYNGNSTTEELTPNILVKQISLYSKLFIAIFILVLIAIISILIIFIKRKKSLVI